MSVKVILQRRRVRQESDGLWYIKENHHFIGERRIGKGYKHSTSAWAALGKLFVKDIDSQCDDQKKR